MSATRNHLTVSWSQISGWGMKSWYYHYILSKISSPYSNWALESENTKFRIRQLFQAEEILEIVEYESLILQMRKLWSEEAREHC